MASFLNSVVMPGHSRLKDGVASARLCAGHPRLFALRADQDVDGNIDIRARSAKAALRDWQGTLDSHALCKPASRCHYGCPPEYPACQCQLLDSLTRIPCG